MKWLKLATLVAGAFALALLPLGCGDDDDDGGNGGGGGLEGEYELYAGFMNESDVDGASVEGMVFVATVERRNSADPSAKTADVRVNGTVIPLVTSESTDSEATFRNEAIAYEPETSYAVTITIGGETASSTIVTPDYTTTVAITAPAEGAEFTPGQALTVSWSYTPATPTPAKVLLAVWSSTATEDEELYEQLLNGNPASFAIPGSETATWDDFEDVTIGVGAGLTQSWSGEMAYEGSYSFVLISTDTATIHPAGGGQVWTLTLEAAPTSIETGGTSTLTVTITDDQEAPPPAGTTVNLTVTPPSAATVTPATVQTTAQGTATATLTAGSTAGTVTVNAVAPTLDNASDQVSVSITGGGAPGVYDISAGFLTAAEDDPGFIAVVHRLNPEDPSAKDAVVTVNDTEVPISLLASSDSLAMFESTDIPYAASTDYEIVVTLGEKTATSSFTSPSYLCTIQLTAPTMMSEFTAGENLEAAWTLTGDQPPTILLAAGGDDEEDPGYVYEELPGTARSYSIDTSDWTEYEMAAVVVSVGEAYDFTGNLASELSGSYVNLTTAMAIVVAAGSGEQWSVTVDTYRSVLAPDGADTTTVWAWVEDYLGQPCPDGQTVTFTVSGPGTLAYNTAQTADGWASTILTAGDTEGTVTIQAEAYGQTDATTVLVSEGAGEQYLMLITFPLLDPSEPTLAPGGSTTLEVSLKTLQGDPCPDGTEVTLTSITADLQTDYLTFGDTTLSTTDGEATTSVTAGSTVPFGGIVSVIAATEAFEYSGGAAGLFIQQ